MTDTQLAYQRHREEKGKRDGERKKERERGRKNEGTATGSFSPLE